MRIAYFDPIGGASGDMIVASLIDAGVDETALRDELAKLPLEGFAVSAHRQTTHQIAASRFCVDAEHHAHGHHHEARTIGAIRGIISASALSDSVKDRAIRVFQALGEAEAKVHGTTIDEIHFHEVGAVDSIVDIVAACIGLEKLGVEKLFVGPLPLSRGTVRCAHGEWPVPGPATTELLKGFRWRNTDIEGELVTPTAAAIFATLGEDSARMPGMTVHHTGYGAGQNDYGIPNVLRVCVGDTQAFAEETDVVVIETAVDDQNPELLEWAMDRLFAAGALDVWFTPIQMKKNRPAVKISALAPAGLLEAVGGVLLRETSTLGYRWWPASRNCLPRRIETVQTPAGPVRVKISSVDGRPKAAPEYEDVRRLAEESGKPAREIYNEALRALSD